MVAIHSDIAKFAMSLQHSAKTDISRGQVNNSDFIILMLYAYGPFGLTELRELSSGWRGGHQLQAYFSPTYGHTGTEFACPANGRYVVGRMYGGAPNHAPFWYRASQGVRGKSRYTNALTVHGFIRLGELLRQAGMPGPVSPF